MAAASVLEVHDDGCGCDADAAERRFREGHCGLRLLHDLVADAGGRLDIEPAPQGGTVVSVSLAARLAHPVGRDVSSASGRSRPARLPMRRQA